ncbi:hypothetical protein CN210_16810 [Sinorhizobium meliloti]|nr:hypothetical protein Sinme_6807 [Sinorhizobium meliloti AK83]ASP54013.1 hypothetical protein CDO31_21160 [Sinorhizobium meliloti]QGJ76566.1 hypothetical protein C3L21_21450 [Sinorhizobium meliloti]RMC65092.1 hypothetical protein EBB04_21315 [Sinorhizobium meliloti]RMI15883.1 hypothetical protein DA102_027910 [Sinorhizobium meliloti]
MSGWSESFTIVGWLEAMMARRLCTSAPARKIAGAAGDPHSSPEAARQAREQVGTNRSFTALSLVDSAFNCVL